MKFSLKFGTLAVTTALGLSLSACGEKAAEEPADPVEQAAAQTAAALDQQVETLPTAPASSASDAAEDATDDGAQ